MSVTALRQIPAQPPYQKGDSLVLFGELFARGYANGIVEEAEKAGMTIVRSTVGRRVEGELRPLQGEDLAKQAQPFINIPLMAGFDQQKSSKGLTPLEQLAHVKMSDWQSAKLDWAQIEESKKIARQDFRKRVQAYVSELAKSLKPDSRVLIAHLMAGGVPQAKVLLATMNRVFKAKGDKFIPSEEFWKSDMGKLCSENFNEVTAFTLKVLLEETQSLREKFEKAGGQISYVAYGYHGTEVLIDNQYQWQTYSPYVQGWAKRELENIAKEAYASGVKVSVYNCPEILTNSSSIFQGLEVSLYPLMGALKKEGGQSTYIKNLLAACEARFKEGVTLDKVMDFTNKYMKNPVLLKHSVYEKWPQHNSREQMEFMIQSSEELQSWHKDEKELCNFLLSEEVFKATGLLMLREGYKPHAPVLWIGHDVIAKALALNA